VRHISAMGNQKPYQSKGGKEDNSKQSRYIALHKNNGNNSSFVHIEVPVRHTQCSKVKFSEVRVRNHPLPPLRTKGTAPSGGWNYGGSREAPTPPTRSPSPPPEFFWSHLAKKGITHPPPNPLRGWVLRTLHISVRADPKALSERGRNEMRTIEPVFSTNNRDGK